MIPKIPKDMSMNCQKNGISRIAAKIRVQGTIKAQAIIPNSTTHMFLTGSRKGPMKAMAIWPKVS